MSEIVPEGFYVNQPVPPTFGDPTGGKICRILGKNVPRIAWGFMQPKVAHAVCKILNEAKPELGLLDLETTKKIKALIDGQDA